MTDYNPKIDYLICKFLSSQKFEIDDEKVWKAVYFMKTEPKNEAQKIMLKCKKILEFIKNENIDFNIFNIKKCYKTLTNEDLKLNSNQYIQLNNIINNFSYDKSSNYAGLVFIKILQTKIFNKYNIEMAKILHNFIQIKNDYLPAIFYHFQTNKIIKLIEQNEIDGALLVLKESYQRTNHFNTKHRLIHFNEINDIIKNLKSKLIFDFGVTELYIFGSFSRGDENEYSDLDLFINVNKNFKENKNNRCYITSLLEKELGISLDIKINDGEVQEVLMPDMIRFLQKII